MLLGKGDTMFVPRKLAVLVVDDDPGVRDLISAVLQGAGFDVHEAEDGLAALAILGGLLPDAIISDLEMPRMSGYELIPAVRRRFPQVPVIVLSGAAQPDVPPEIAADLYLRKGEFRAAELCQRVSELVQVRGLLSQQDADQAAWEAMKRIDEPCND
jgi:CheY-like chemotaxis protein